MIQSANFGRWLERLGFKRLEQPTILQTVQPVAIVADHSQLVSPALDPSGCVGGTSPSSLVEFSAFQFFGPSPVWIDAILSNAQAGEWAIQIGAGAATLPALTLPVTLPRQEFRPGGDVRCQQGSIPAIAPDTVPAIRSFANNHLRLYRIHKPPGGWVQFSFRSANAEVKMAAWIYELPSENAQ